MVRGRGTGGLEMASTFSIATWYDTWNQTGLENLSNRMVPLGYATRCNLAFGELSGAATSGYTVSMPGPFADEVKREIVAQAPSMLVYVGLGDTGLSEAV